MGPVLEVRDLQVSYYARSGARCRAVAGASFNLGVGEILGVLGESGSGKSTLAASLVRVLPPNAEITSGAALLDGKDLLRLEPQELRKVRGHRISLIFQEPSLALHPTMRVADQISEVLRAHESLDRRATRERVHEVLRAVFPSEVEDIAARYPHQLSGGQRQRVLIAQAIACRPALLIADEPTASLDAVTQREVISLFAKLRDELGIAVLLITHSPSLLVGIANRVLILYAGNVAELGSTADVLFAPKHPYTRALLRSMPAAVDGRIAPPKVPLPAIAGEHSNLAVVHEGCAFEPRCQERMEICRINEPGLTAVSKAHDVSCWKFTN